MKMSKENELFNLDCNLPKEKKTKKQILKEATDNWIQNSDEESYKILFEYYYPKLLNFAKYRFFVDDPDLAEDCIIEGFAVIYEKTSKYYKNQGFQFNTWMYTVCKNICLEKLKKKSKRNKINLDISEMSQSMWTKNNKLSDMTETINENFGEIDPILLTLPDEPMSKDMIWQKTLDVSLGLIDKLDSISADLIKEKFLNKTKIKDLAEKYQVGESYIKNHIYNGLKLIKKQFKENYEDLYETFLESQGEFDTYFEK